MGTINWGVGKGRHEDKMCIQCGLAGIDGLPPGACVIFFFFFEEGVRV